MSVAPAPLPQLVYATHQVREFDRCAIELLGISGFELMQRAGRAALDVLQRRWPRVHAPLVLCGAGNNAGDGYVLAALARRQGLEPRIVAVTDPNLLTGDAARAVALARDNGILIEPFDPVRREPGSCDLMIDALLGTGLTRPVTGDLACAVAMLNASRHPVLALDVPTGLDGDSGAICGVAVAADVTVSFVGLKSGLYLGSGPDLCGQIECSALGIPADVFAGAVPVMRRTDESDLSQVLKPRAQTSHKGLNGKVLIIGGGSGMGGAARLAAEAALRAGAGLVHAAVAPDSAAAMLSGRPEIMCRGVSGPDDITDWLASADVVVAGPGLGRSQWADQMVRAAIDSPRPLILDADGLNYLAENRRSRKNWVLTPHPGEAGRLLGESTADVQAARLDCAGQIARTYGALCVLKGACSLTAQVDENSVLSVSVCDRGNPGMATAGMGDVLAGVIGGLVAQFGLSASVVQAAVLIHACAGDDAAAAGERGMLASDLLPFIRRRVNP